MVEEISHFVFLKVNLHVNSFTLHSLNFLLLSKPESHGILFKPTCSPSIGESLLFAAQLLFLERLLPAVESGEFQPTLTECARKPGEQRALAPGVNQVQDQEPITVMLKKTQSPDLF